MKKTLLEHRQELKENKYAYIADIPRCFKTVVKHLKDAGFKRITLNRAPDEIQNFVVLIYKAQGIKPFFHIESEDGLPFCWNSPYKGGWGYDYIRLEWGHLNSINQNQETAYHVENLCLQSARCNQHIQSSLNAHELKAYGGKLEEVIDKNLESREKLFKSSKWRELLDTLEKWK